MLFHLVYASIQAAPFFPESLAEMVERSRVRNERQGITSVLIHHQGAFLHGLEGKAAAVQALYAKVCADPRHRNIELLVQIKVDQRLFTGQPMGFHDAVEERLDFGGQEPGLLDAPASPHGFSWRAVLALRLLTRFRS